ncbi:MAG: envelope stress response membrane protein PspB [Spartobacteria bacterium]|nr:envelope stress response membrane protein PspB [Spartobacteria bacterium]
MGSFFGLIFIIMAAGILLVGAVLLGLIKMFTKTGENNTAKESQMIQEMYQGMTRMEQRIETLETILLEKDGKEKSS